MAEAQEVVAEVMSNVTNATLRIWELSSEQIMVRRVFLFKGQCCLSVLRAVGVNAWLVCWWVNT
jgi:hypothetical protein